MSFLSYIFWPRPPQIGYDNQKLIAVLVFCGGLILISFIMKRWRKKLRNSQTKKLSRSWPSAALWFGIVGLLLGVSRTFKTPLSVYMASRGWLVPNIPIVLDSQIPQIVYELPPEKIFCLTTIPTVLSRLRNVRNEYLQGGASKYASYDYVRKEISYANMLFNAQSKWTKVKVTAKPIETRMGKGKGKFVRYCSRILTHYDPYACEYYPLIAGGGSGIEVMTDFNVSGTVLYKKTRTLQDVALAPESDWTVVHSGIDCSGTG